MDVDVLVHHLADGVVIAHLRRNQIISRVNANVWFLRIHIALDKHSESATVASDDESRLSSASSFTLSCSGSTSVLSCDTVESGHRVNREELLPWVAHGKALVLSVGSEQENLSVVVADDEASISEPSMTSVVVRVVRFSLPLRDDDGKRFQYRSFKFDVPVEFDTRDNYYILIVWTERNLFDCLILGDVGDHFERANASLLVPIPYSDASLGLGTDGDEIFLILGAKVCRNELFGLIFIRA